MEAETAVKQLADIPGWFRPEDQIVFDHFLGDGAVERIGDVAEVGVYLGKSAAFIGRYVREGQTFTVVDLFGATGVDDANQRESGSYTRLTRDAFERNYLSLLDSLPVIVEGPSSTITEHVAAQSLRFMHIDGSHVFDHVRVDVQSAKALLRPDGIVVFDDFRSPHTPGVSAAVWEAVINFDLKPLAFTTQKFYGTFGDHARHYERLMSWLRSDGHFRVETPRVAGYPTARLEVKRPPAKPPSPPATMADIKRLDKRLQRLERVAANPGRAVLRRLRRKLGR